MLSIGEEPACHSLRHEIEALADPDLPPSKRFFPKSKLKAICTLNRVKDVLKCRCQRCQGHFNILSEFRAVQDDENILKRLHGLHEHGGSLTLIFALLVYIECPQLVVAFLKNQGQVNDDILEAHIDTFTADFLRLEAWPEYDKKAPQDSLALARAFRWNKYKFAVPYMNDERYSIYDEHTILPFLEEEPVGRRDEHGEVIPEGAFGKVYSFKIPPEYQLFSHAAHINKFARKELHSTTPMRFEAERRNLELVKKLEDPHLVRILKAYKHGDTFNLIFPCAKTNLGMYLRDELYEAPQPSGDRIELSPLWSQLLGLANALEKIINYHPPQLTSGEQCLYGYHFDLKPANILVEDSGTFIISDFGQATFKDVGGTSKVSGMGGTEAYAPPEIDGRDERYNRKYDIWSLGCIFVEVCTFAVKGFGGINQFDKLRVTSTGANRYDDRFFCRIDGTNRYQIKPGIRTWVEGLPNSDSIHNEQSRDFLKELVGLMMKMLDVNVRQRLTSREVCQDLSLILKRYQSVPVNRPARVGTNHSLPPDEVEFGKDIVPQLHSMMYYRDDDWRNGPVRIVEDCSRELMVVTSTDSQEVRLPIGTRLETKVIPRYAYDYAHHQGFADCHIYFYLTGHTEGGRYQPTKIFFNDLRDAVKLHSVLMGQEVRRTLGLSSAVFEKLPPLSQRVRGVLPGPRATGRPVDVGKASTVQFWSEKSYKDPAVRQRKDSPRGVTQSFLLGPAPRRIVIYFETSLLIVKIAKNARIEKHQTGPSHPTSLRIVPTDKHRDSSFVVSLLTPTPVETVAGIPISKDNLEQEEAKGRFECRSLELTFKRQEDLKAFVACYRKLKDEWHDAANLINQVKKEMGELLGYAPD